MAYFVPCTQTFKDAVADPLSARYLKILIDIDDDDVLEDVTADLDNNQVQGGGKIQGEIGVGTKQYAVKLRNAKKKYAEGDFAGAICAIEAKVGTAEYIRIFTGVVSEEGCSRTKRTKSGDTVTIQMNDASKSKGMRSKCNPVVYVNYKICDTATPANSIFHKLAALLGLAAGDLETVTIDQTKDYLPLTQKRTAWQELQDLCAQYIGHMCFRYDGKLRFISRHQTGWTDPVSEWTFDADNIHSPWKGRSSPIKCNRVKTEFEKYENLGQRVIYKNTDEWDSALERNAIAVTAGAYWPGPNAGDKAQLNYKDPVSGEKFPIGISIQTPTIGAVASGSDIECENGLLTLTSFNGSTGATQQNPGNSEIILHNNTGSTIYVRKFETRGTALRIQKKVIVEDVDAGVTDEWNYVDKTIPGKYAVSDTRAHVSTQRWVEFGKVKRKLFDHVTDWIPQIQEGAVITFHPDDVINMSAVVESFQHQCSGSMRKWKTGINIREKESFTPSGSASVIEEEQGESATETGDELVAHQIRIDSLAGLEPDGTHKNDDPVASDEELFEFSSPDCVSNEARVPTDKIIHLEPAEYTDERGILYRNPHTKMWNGLSEAIFQQGTNLVKSPEALIPPDWTETDAKAVLTGQYVNGLQLTKVLVSAGYGNVWQAITFTGDGKKAISITARKGDDTASEILLRDITIPINRLDFTITWATQVITEITGIVHEANWIDDETVEILAISVSVTAANVNRLYLYSVTNTKYTYFTAAQALNSIYPFPYIPLYRYPTRVHPTVSPNYRVDMQGMMVFKIKLKPWFTYDTTGYPVFLLWRIDGSHRFKVYWERTLGKFRIYWIDGVAGKNLFSQQFDDGTTYDDINSELVVCGAVRFDQQTGQRFFVIVDGVKQTEDTDFSGAPDTKASAFPTLSIGHETKAEHADSLIESVQIWDWDGTDLGTIDNEADFDAAVASLTERFSHTLEDYDSKYQPLSKRGAIGAFQAIENECDSPEDMTGTDWTTLASNCTSTLSDYYIGGHRFTKLLNSAAAAGYVAYAIAASTFTATPCSLSLVAKYGNAAVSKAELYDATAPASRIVFTITWATFMVAASTGIMFEAHWISPDTVEILLISAAITVGNVHHLRVYASNAATLNEYTYWTCAFPHDSTYPLPYTPIAREKSILNYTLRMPPVFTVMFCVRPWFAYDVSAQRNFISWRIDASHTLIIFFDQSNDKIDIGWINGGSARYLYSQQFDDGTTHDDINQWIHVAAKIDLTGGQTGSALWINGIQRDADWGGAIDAYTDDFPTLNIGHEIESNQADSMLADLLFYPGLVDDSVIKDHYLKNRPWYEPSEIANAERTVRIDRSGIKLHNTSLTITDQYNRLIDISNQAGMKARDAAGKIIHDIPDALIQKGNWYLGHDLWNDDLVTYKVYDVVTFPQNAWTDVTCLTNANSNVKKAIFKIRLYGYGAYVNFAQYWIFLRPKGTSWSYADASNVPVNKLVLQFSSNLCSSVESFFVLECPMGDDNKVQFFALVAPNSTSRRLIITQLGLGI